MYIHCRMTVVIDDTGKGDTMTDMPERVYVMKNDAGEYYCFRTSDESTTEYIRADVHQFLPWVSVNERLPTQNAVVLVWVDTPIGKQAYDLAVLGSLRWFLATPWDFDVIVKYWMPLPSMPESKMTR